VLRSGYSHEGEDRTERARDVAPGPFLVTSDSVDRLT
jgi:hypothetical protein